MRQPRGEVPSDDQGTLQDTPATKKRKEPSMARARSSNVVALALTDNEYCKRLKDPFRNDVFHLEVFLPFTQAVRLPRGNANVRPPNPKKPAYKAMLETVDTAPQTFHVKNRGITYFCDRFEYDNSKKLLSITVPIVSNGDDELKYGIADGGHTFGVIEDTVNRLPDFKGRDEWSEPSVRVHFVAGRHNLPTSDEEIVEALNTSSQVQQYTLDEYAEEFGELKEALEKAGFDVNLVAFRENEEKEWHVLEIIQRMACFLKDRWQITQPASMYRSKGKALELYTNESTRGEFRRVYDVIKDVLTLPEFIQAELSTGEAIRGRRLGKVRVVKPLKKPFQRPGTPYQTEHKLDMAALLPMAAAFRELLALKGDRYTWRVDPKKVFRHCAEQLYTVLLNRIAKVRVTSQLASDMEYWSACVPIVMRAKDAELDTKG